MTRLILVSVVFSIFSSVAFADEWSCTDSTGNTYAASQSVYSDTCTNLATNEVREPNRKPKSPQFAKPHKSKPAEAKAAMVAGKAAVLAGLRDPNSAQFKSVFTRNDFFVCGEVNARNGMGGYVGFKRFVALGKVGLVKYDDDSQEFSDYWLTSCEGLNQSWIDEVRQIQRN